MGKAWDRHLFALRDLAARKGLETPTLFTDEVRLPLRSCGAVATCALTMQRLDGAVDPPPRDCLLTD